MITLADFQNYLSHKILLRQSSHYSLIGGPINEQEQQLLKWAASLPAQTQTQQVMQLEQILTELATVELEDSKRLKLLSIAVSAADRLITLLHKHYHHELGVLNAEQLLYSNQVKSLYYLMILAYDGIIQRAGLALKDSQEKTKPSLKSWFALAKNPPLTLAAAIYQTLSLYQKLLYEQDLTYQPPPAHLWSAFNHLYYLACQAGVAHNDLTMQVVTKQALSIHELYVQICLHGLLNVRAMTRSNILLLQRLLPKWSTHVSATSEPLSYTRIFVNLQSANPPEYLSASSATNPYDEKHHCLFIDFVPLTLYLYQHKQNLLNSPHESVEYQLVSDVLMAIKYRYIDRQTSVATKYSPKQRATIITGFNNIHYKVAGKLSLMSMIAAKELLPEQLPRYDTLPKNRVINTLNVDTFDSTDTVSIFRALHLLAVKNPIKLQTKPDKEVAKALRDDNLSADNSDDIKDKPYDELTIKANIAPPPLFLMSLFLLCRSEDQLDNLDVLNNLDDNITLKWSLGMVRWLNFESRCFEPKYIEVEWQVLGHTISACALRLDDRDQRAQNFVPALMVAGDEALQTAFTIIVPPYHFRSNDKVMLRINDKQQQLRLQECLLSSKTFNQYKVMQL